MKSGSVKPSRQFRPAAEPMEGRIVLSAASAAAIRMILTQTPGFSPYRPNTPVLPLEAPATAATFIDPTVQVIKINHIALGQRDYLAPYVSLDSRGGFIKIGSNSTIQDNAHLKANPTPIHGGKGILIGDNVVVGPGASITGPTTIGATNGAATSIGANAIIDGAVIQAGAFVGALARVGPGVTINTGVRVLPGANVTNQAQATNPALGQVAFVTTANNPATAAFSMVLRNIALANGYTNLFQGNSATGPGTSSGGPIPAALTNTGVYFGALNNVLGISNEPGSRYVSFEPSSGTPTFRAADGSNNTLAENLSFNFPARIIGQVVFGEDANGVRGALGRRDSIRADEGQPFVFSGPIGAIGNGVTIHSPLGGVRTTTTTTVVTTTTNPAGVTTTTTTTSAVVTNAAPTATTGSTTATTTSRTAAGLTTGTVVTTIATSTTLVGVMSFGANLRVGDNATLLGGPSQLTSFGDNVTIGSGAVVETSTIGSNATIGDRSYISNSVIPAGAVIAPGSIIINNIVVGTVRS